MKDLKEYYYDFAEDKVINEGLLSWFKAFFKKIYKNQRSRVTADNKVNMYKVNTHNMKVQKEAVKLNELDKETINLMGDKQTGYLIGSLIFKNQNKYLKDGDRTYDPYVQCYFVKDGNATYSVGMIMFDDTVSFVDGYKHIIDLESNLIVDNPTEVNKTMIEQYAESVKESGVKGFTSKASLHPKLKANLMGAGFKPSNTDKEIYVYNIK